MENKLANRVENISLQKKTVNVANSGENSMDSNKKSFLALFV